VRLETLMDKLEIDTMLEDDMTAFPDAEMAPFNVVPC